MKTFRTTADVAAPTAIVWVAAATLHEGLGHGVACRATGGVPVAWSTFHFDCAKQALSPASWRIVAGAGTAVNVGLMALGLAGWRHGGNSTLHLAAWIVFVINGLTAFGYLVFSAAFGIGDWNGAGVMTGVSDVAAARLVLGVVGIAGYYAVVRTGAAMLARDPVGSGSAADVRRLALTIWLTTGAVSLLAALMAGDSWRTTLGASIGVALGGNAGLLSMARFVRRSPRSTVPTQALPATLTGGPVLWAMASLCVLGFVLILGPGLRL